MMTLSDEQKEQLAPDPARDLEPAMTMKQWLDEASAKLIAQLQEESKEESEEQRDGK